MNFALLVVSSNEWTSQHELHYFTHIGVVKYKMGNVEKRVKWFLDSSCVSQSSHTLEGS